jgi:hypothetical protein
MHRQANQLSKSCVVTRVLRPISVTASQRLNGVSPAAQSRCQQAFDYFSAMATEEELAILKAT